MRPGSISDIQVPAGQRAMAVQVDQVTGVGTVIKTGDYVDMVIGLTGDKFPVITVNSADNTLTVVSGINNTSVKLILQGMQVLGTLLPPPDTSSSGSSSSGSDNSSGSSGDNSGQPATALNGQQEIVVLSVTPQQAEVIKYSQMDSSISLILRSADDFIDPLTGREHHPAAGRDDRCDPEDPRRHLRRPAAGSRRDRDPRQPVDSGSADPRPSISPTPRRDGRDGPLQVPRPSWSRLPQSTEPPGPRAR